jgi:hypothetical protein
MNAPLYSETFENWVDNTECTVIFDNRDGFGYSTYLWVFTGLSSHIGIWAMYPLDGCEYFVNGFEQTSGERYGYRVQAMVLIPD